MNSTLLRALVVLMPVSARFGYSLLVSRLAFQREDLVNAGLFQMEKEAFLRLDNLVSTIEHLLTPGLKQTSHPCLGIDDSNLIAGIIDKQFFSSTMLLPQDQIELVGSTARRARRIGCIGSPPDSTACIPAREVAA